MLNTEDYKEEVQKLQDTLDSYSEELVETLRDRIDQAALNWLVTYGMPETPHDVWTIFYALYRSVPAMLAGDEYIEFTPKARATAEEVASRKEERRNSQQSLFGDGGNALKDLADKFFGDSNQPPTVGQYL